MYQCIITEPNFIVRACRYNFMLYVLKKIYKRSLTTGISCRLTVSKGLWELTVLLGSTAELELRGDQPHISYIQATTSHRLDFMFILYFAVARESAVTTAQKAQPPRRRLPTRAPPSPPRRSTTPATIPSLFASRV
jgi:hypothetical protein